MIESQKLSIILFISKMLKAIPELKTNRKSIIGIKGNTWPNSKYCSAIDFDSKSIAIKKSIKK